MFLGCSREEEALRSVCGWKKEPFVGLFASSSGEMGGRGRENKGTAGAGISGNSL